MTSMELDPLFVKGLRLLHSKNKDSAEQLKQLLDDAIAQSKQSVHAKDRIYTTVKSEGDSKIHLKKTLREAAEVSTYSSKLAPDITRDRKVEKRSFEKVKPDSPESSEAKIPKLETPQVYNYYPPLGSPDIPKLEQYVSKKEEETDSSDENADAGDFAMEMGLACVICKQIEVTQGNQLIECQECHSLYHQECHRPPASDYDVNDPRRVWYCAKCVKSMKKMATKSQKTAKTVVTSTAKEPVTQTKVTKSDSPPALILPFKRTEVKPTITQGNTQTSANKPIGLAGLAANFGNRTAVSTATTSLSSSSRVPKTTTPTLGSKSHSTFTATTTAKTLSTSSTLLSKMTSSTNVFQTLSSTTTTQSVVTPSSQKPPTSTSSAKGLRLLSAAVASTSSRAASSAPSGNGNSGHKVASCSPLMSADKRLQIMKKKASKQQEKRRLSSK